MSIFQETQELSIAYHLFSYNLRLNNIKEASAWLKTLKDGQWQSGFDFDDLTMNKLSSKDQQTIQELNQDVQASNHHIELVFEFDAIDLIPESFAYNPDNNTWFIGSLLHHNVLKMNQHNKASNYQWLSNSTKLGSVFGIKLHNDLLYILSNHQQYAQINVTSMSGEIIDQAILKSDKEHQFNDLCIHHSGVFISDSLNHTVYQYLPGNSSIRPFFSAPDIKYINGIACENDSDIYLADYRSVVKINVKEHPNHTRIFPNHGHSLAGIDGLYLWQNKLVGIQNAMGQMKIIITNLSGNLVNAIALNNNFFRIPTTGVILENELFFIGSSSSDLLNSEGQLIGKPDASRIFKLNLNQTISDEVP